MDLLKLFDHDFSEINLVALAPALAGMHLNTDETFCRNTIFIINLRIGIINDKSVVNPSLNSRRLTLDTRSYRVEFALFLELFAFRVVCNETAAEGGVDSANLAIGTVIDCNLVGEHIRLNA